MPEFTYVAIDDFGRRVRGTATADTEDALVESLREQGRYLIRASLAGARTNLAEIRLFERITRRDVVFFTSQLATILATGVNLVEGLGDIDSQIKKPVMKRVVAAIRRDIESGLSLSAALARHPKAFSPLYVNIVQAGEATGRVDRVLEDLVVQLEWQDSLNGRIREAATYPIIVVFMMTVLVIVLVGFTIPRFMQIYERLNAQIELPFPTRVLMAFSTYVRTYWLVLTSAVLTAVVGLRVYAQTPAGAVRLHRTLLRVPVLGELARKIALSRFAHYFGTLHEAGLEVAPSLSLVERLIGNAYLSQQFHRAVDRVMAGDSLSRALQRVGEFPPIVIQMISLGERTGRMSKSLEDVRRYFDSETDRTVKQALTLFGPIMLIVLASTFVLMALAFYLPLFQLMRTLR